MWAHTGRDLFYRSASRELVAVGVRTQPTFSTGARQVLFPTQTYEANRNHTSYDISPGDQQFVFIKQVGGSRDIIVVMNWFEELKERVGK